VKRTGEARIPVAAWGILAAALVFRLVCGLVQSGEIDAKNLPDQAEYLSLGRGLLASGELRFFDDRFNDTVRAFRMPGYAALVAACGGSPRAVRIFQALLDTATVLAAGLLARRVAGDRAMLLAMGIVALNPLLIYFSALILTETLTVSLLAWAMLLLHRRAWWGGAVLLAAAVLVRPNVLLLSPLLAMVAAHGLPLRSRLTAIAAPLLMSFVVLLPWAWRNSRVLDAWIWTTTNTGITLYDGFNPAATGASDQSFVKSWVSHKGPPLNEVERSEYLTAQAWDYIVHHPARVVELTVIKAARTLSPVPLSTAYASKLTWAIGLGYTLPLMILTAVGVWRAGIPRSLKVYLLLPTIYLTAVHALSVGSLRYRIPAEPPMAVIAALAILPRSNETKLPDVRS